MSYEFLSMEDTGTRTGDVIMRLRWKPSPLRRWFGTQEETIAYFGQDTEWYAMDGLPAHSRICKMLEQLWHRNQPRTSADRTISKVARRIAPRIQAACFDIVDEAAEGSFPASDPPAWTLGR